MASDRKRLEGLPSMNEINLDRGLFNAVYLRLLNKVYSYMVLYGGSGSGKSTFIGQLLAVQMTVLPGRNLACLRVQKTDCLKSCYGEIYHWLRKFKLLRYWQIIKSPQVVLKNKVNGNQIIFEGVDEIEDIKELNPVTGEITGIRNHISIFPAFHYVTDKADLDLAVAAI